MDNQTVNLYFCVCFCPCNVMCRMLGCPGNQCKHGSSLLGALAAAPLRLLGVSGSDGA